MVIKFILKRLGAAVILLLVLTAIIFVLQALSPGNSVKAYVGNNASPAAIAAAKHKLGLDQPIPVQYVHYLGNLVRGDLGLSYRTHLAVTSDLQSYLPATAELVLVAFTFAVALGLLFAFSGALHWPGSAAYRVLLLVLATAPPFLLAIGGVVVFYAQLGWLPASGQGNSAGGPTGLLLIDDLLHGDLQDWGDALLHLLLPAVVLSIAPAVAIGRILRSSLQSTLRAEYVRTAESKGLTPFTVFRRHVLRNSVGPALSMAGLQLGFMFAGVVVVEQIFSWPGIGNYLANSIPVSDFPAIAGVTLVLGAIYIVVNAIVDVLQAVADPRLNA